MPGVGQDFAGRQRPFPRAQERRKATPASARPPRRRRPGGSRVRRSLGRGVEQFADVGPGAGLLSGPSKTDGSDAT